MDLATMGWVDRHEDLVLIGQSGVGKSHIAKALCLVACSKDIRVQYTTCADLLTPLHASLADGKRGANLGATTNGLLRLLDAYGADEVNVALGEVLERDAPHLSAVRQVLDQRRSARQRHRQHALARMGLGSGHCRSGPARVPTRRQRQRRGEPEPLPRRTLTIPGRGPMGGCRTTRPPSAEIALQSFCRLLA